MKTPVSHLDRLLALALLLCTAISTADAASIRIQIAPSAQLPNPNTLPPSTHATLTAPTGEVYTAPIRSDNSIVFPHLHSTGEHLLDVYSRDHVFAAYRIDVASIAEDATTTEQTATRGPGSGSGSGSGAKKYAITGAWETYRGTNWSDRGVALVTSNPSLNNGHGVDTLTFVPKVLGTKNFYDQRQGFNPLSLLKNPMILMGVVALAFTVGMPKLLENMDPEMRAEYDEMQKKGPMSYATGLQGAAGGAGAGAGAGAAGAGGGVGGFDLAGYLAGTSTSAGAGTGGSANGNGGKATGRDGADGIRDRRR